MCRKADKTLYGTIEGFGTKVYYSPVTGCESAVLAEAIA